MPILKVVYTFGYHLISKIVYIVYISNATIGLCGRATVYSDNSLWMKCGQ